MSAEDIGETLRRMARTAKTPKELLKSVQKAHPEAGKKAITHAALLSMIAVADSEPQSAAALQDLAMQTRIDRE